MAQPQSTTKKQPPQVLFANFSEAKRDLIFIGILYVILLVMFNKIVFNDMMFADSGDTVAAEAWSQAGLHIEQTENVEPLWIPNPFGGMPGFGSLAYIPRNVNYLQLALQWIGKVLFLNATWGWMVLHILLAGVFMYFAGRTLFPGPSGQLPSLLGALTFMLNPYLIGLAQAGQGSKLFALSYIPLLFLLTHNLFKRRDVLSLGLLAIAIGTSLLTNHVQMVFYGFVVIGSYLLWEVISEIKQQPKPAMMKTLMFVGAFVLGFAISAYVYLSVQEYSSYSIRGGGGGEGAGAGGLDYDYATNWSFHPFEVMNYLLPSFFGYQSPYYWGWMPFTDSTVYIGIIPLVLALFALFYKRNRITMFFAVLSAVMFLISFGKHFSLLYDLMFNYFPFFNKFRVPVMILHLIPFTFGMLALYGYNALIEMQGKDFEKKRTQLFKVLRVTVIVIAAVLVIGFVAKDGVYSFLSDFMFKRAEDMKELQQQYGAQAQQILPQLERGRFDLLWDDYIKFALIACATLGLMIAFLKNKIQSLMMTLGFLVILSIDLIMLDTNYINPKPNTALGQHFAPDATVQFLQQDKSQFRVYQIGNFMDNTYMYHGLQLVGGYSPAKIKIYQEMIDSIGLHPFRFPLNMGVLNMLNTKYFVVPGQLPPDTNLTVVNFDQSKSLLTYQNKNFLPRAWFVDEITVTNNKREIFTVLRSETFDPKKIAVLEQSPSVSPVKSESSFVSIDNYKSREISYTTYSTQSSLLVFSEVYYPAGWNAFIDGQETEIYKTNFVLRSVVVPAGNHTIEMKFNPPLYETGFSITLGAWAVSVLLVGYGFFKLKNRKEVKEK
ncbi:MAG: YfhO family protein [Ignavibacteriae bacterium]|nr:YfhO family protein [Ignavibacteriota bacterium]